MGTDENQQMIPIALSEFLNGMEAPADLYVRMESGKAILLFKSGAPFDNERLEKYKSRNVTHLWVYVDAFHELCNNQVKLANAGISLEFLNASKKMFLISNAAQSVFRIFERIGVDLNGFENAQKTTHAVLEFSKLHFDIETMIGLLLTAESHRTSHAVATSIMATTLGREMGMETEANMQKLALAGLLHDIGKLKLDPKLFEKPVSELGGSDLQAYQNHSLLGAELIKGLGLNSEDLIQIILQHHERNDGTGYPQGFKTAKIHPLAKIVGLCSEFFNLTMPNPKFKHLTKHRPVDALAFLHGGLGKPYDKELIEALKRVIVTKYGAAPRKTDQAA